MKPLTTLLTTLYTVAFIYAGAGIIYVAVSLPQIIQELDSFNKAPTTYETGLYVESENIQPASKERLQ